MEVVDEKIKDQPDGEKSRPTRREVIRWLLSFSVISTLGGVLTPIAGYLWPPVRASSHGTGGRTLVGAVTDYPLNSGQVVSVNDEPVMVVNTEAGGFKAYSAVCTHLGCITYWHQTRQLIQCPCHDGRFNPVTGAVISGPPPRPLPPYELEIVGEQVYVGDVVEERGLS
jgi:cytochrome b6-f complex iron-sulfur subunit